jgi:hypothetical protein
MAYYRANLSPAAVASTRMRLGATPLLSMPVLGVWPARDGVLEEVRCGVGGGLEASGWGRLGPRCERCPRGRLIWRQGMKAGRLRSGPAKGPRLVRRVRWGLRRCGASGLPWGHIDVAAGLGAPTRTRLCPFLPPCAPQAQMTASELFVAPGRWRYARLEGAGHWPQRDAPDALSALLLGFLAEGGGPRGGGGGDSGMPPRARL